MDNLYNQKVINANNVFGDSFLDSKILYLYSFIVLPNIHFIGQIDGEKAFMAIKEKFATNIVNIHQTTWYKRKKKRFQSGAKRKPDVVKNVMSGNDRGASRIVTVYSLARLLSKRRRSSHSECH